MFSKVVICGVGLIGGSIARALRRAGVVDRIVGVGRSPSSLDEALAAGVIDEATNDWATALSGADAVVLATPVGQFESILQALAPHLAPSTLLTDAGSTKADVVALLDRHLTAEQRAYAVPAHPIAGAEKSGVSAASDTLFDGRHVVLTPSPDTAPDAMLRATELWSACGARVSMMSAAEHDAVFAAVSHLPHVLAFALVDDIAQRDNATQLFGFAGGGFRDFTRIASSHPEMWRDICLSNRAALLSEIDRFSAALAQFRSLIENEDGAALEARFDHARQARNNWLESA